MKRLTVILTFVLSAVLIYYVLADRPSETSAGGLPCFLCHGNQLQGSDLAPSLADSEMTDEEMIEQIRYPRGVMPAFPEFAGQSFIDIIRSMPTGQPTAELQPHQRSAALATIAPVAASRATEFATVAQEDAISTPTPTHGSLFSAPAPQQSTPAEIITSEASRPETLKIAEPGNVLKAIGGLLVMVGALFFLRWRNMSVN